MKIKELLEQAKTELIEEKKARAIEVVKRQLRQLENKTDDKDKQQHYLDKLLNTDLKDLTNGSIEGDFFIKEDRYKDCTKDNFESSTWWTWLSSTQHCL